MVALSNVKPLEGGVMPSSTGLAADVLPEVNNARQGVSVNYVPAPDKSWYVLRATYGRERLAFDYLCSHGIAAYLPMRYTMRSVRGQRQRTLAPLLPNILFVYATEGQARRLVRHTPALSFLHYYYNRLVTKADGTNPPLTVPRHDMDSFIRATSTGSDHLRVLNPAQATYRIGDPVRVVEGAFSGVVGRVARIAGQQRVVVTLPGLCTVATAYIPTAFLEKIT